MDANLSVVLDDEFAVVVGEVGGYFVLVDGSEELFLGVLLNIHMIIMFKTII